MSEKFDSELWREKAKCKKMGTDTFFSDTDKSSKLTIRKINQAKAICGDCDVQSQCLSYSLDNNIEYGIWGGFTGKEREQIKIIYELESYPISVSSGLVNNTIHMIKAQHRRNNV